MASFMNAWRRRLRHLRRWLGYGFATLLILLAVLVATLGQLLPLLGEHPRAVAEWLSARLGAPVELRAVRGEWVRRGPRFAIEGLRIGVGEQRIAIERAELQLHFYTGWLPGSPLTSLQIESPVIAIERSRDGRWQVRGLGERDADAAPPDFRLLERLGELVLDGARMQVDDHVSGERWALPRVDARLRTLGGEVRIGALAYRDDARPLRLNLTLQPGLEDGHAYIAGRRLDLERWWPGRLPADWRLSAGQADVELWLTLQQRRAVAAQFRVEVDGVRLNRAPVVAETAPSTSVNLPDIRLGGEWQTDAAGWTLTVSRGRDGGWLQWRRDADTDLLQAADWSLAEWRPALRLHPAVTAPLAEWLQHAAPEAELRGLRWQRRAETAPTWSALIDAVAWQAVERRPGLSGVALQLDGVGEQLRVELRGSPLRFDWSALRAPLSPQASGRLIVYRDDAGTPCVEAVELSLRAAEFGIDAEGGLCFDGGAPRADLRAHVLPGPVTAAKQFWIIDKMSPAAVAWLDTALVDGRLAEGWAQVRGDLGDWPFIDDSGRFEALARLDGVTLRYRPDWPLGENLGGNAWFINNGMVVDLSAKVAGIQAQRVTGGIARFRDALLHLDIEGSAPGPELIQLLRASPLWPRLAPGLDGVSIGGRGDIRLALDLALKPNSPPPAVNGTVTLHDADLRHAHWGLALDAAQGDVRFSERGVRVDGLDLLFAGQRGRFALAVGSFASDPGHQVEARLSGRFAPTSLLDTQPELGWLRPHLAGAAAWDIAVNVPVNAGGPPRIELASDLVGTALTLPAPLRKSPAVRMPLQLRIDLGAEQRAIDLRLGELLHLSGNQPASGGFDGIAAFGGALASERPPRGLAVIGQVPLLDASGWMALAEASAGDGEPLLHSVDLQCGALDLLDRAFSETRLQYQTRVDGQRQVRFLGPQLAGQVEIPALPELLTRGITARFERLHWPPAPDDAAPLQSDPRGLPPLHLWAGDLRLGEAALGEARLETFPTAEGMRIESFETRSKALDLSARGDWTLVDGQERSSFGVEFTAQSLGDMLKALGFAELVDGGQTLAKLQATWAGAPSAFSLAVVDGELDISVGKGRIPEVDTGAGRILGLLSLGEIPRRLALDFSDLFRSGLSFNKIQGRFSLDQGNAYTERLVIEGPAAEIRIAGRTGLKTQDYAQTMEVLPRAGNVLPVVGALAGGPAGAALGALAQTVLANPFKQMTRTLYSVSGPWKAPQIEVLERGPAKSDAAAQAAPKAED